MKSSEGRINKSEWIRSQPSTIPAKEIVELAKKNKISLTLAQVYTARSLAKKQGDAGAPEKRKPGRPAGSGKGSNGHDKSVKEQFVQLAIRLGTDEAGRLLQRIVEQQKEF